MILPCQVVGLLPWSLMNGPLALRSDFNIFIGFLQDCSLFSILYLTILLYLDLKMIF